MAHLIIMHMAHTRLYYGFVMAYLLASIWQFHFMGQLMGWLIMDPIGHIFLLCRQVRRCLSAD
jgi:hypothetical protein